ncbi:glycosyltransferase [Fictibacillus fluitans]|uniref:Glycosyltransferase n=1 Tax=Fictibacillus fluitans TaxID=3058422 RepID=A0ABT8I121_9BACL|nr:glycosyltransferase [Fictibacillus sp. NE201]MDN4526720.1 glycosyltransferase [Fictibacillus sp. NE201]
MKKKLLFMVINMNIGGTEKALLSLLQEIPQEKYDVTVLMLEKYGGFLDLIPAWVNVKILDGYLEIKDELNNPPKTVAINYFKKGRLIETIKICAYHGMAKVMKERTQYYKYLLKKFNTYENDYDIAVAYAGPMDFISYFIIYKIRAKYKVQWIHFDVTKIGFNRNFVRKIYSHFDRIYTVSEEGKEKFCKLMPFLKHKTVRFENIISSKHIVEMSERGKGFTDYFDGIRILTVGRLSKEKGQDMTICVMARLKREGYPIRWYSIGEGSARKEYENLIAQYKLEKDYVLLGSTPNPYPFMKQCDLYVQPSRHEGYCITLAEAKHLLKPIVATNFTGAKEQITDELTGLIVDINEEDLYLAIKKILDNPDKCKGFVSQLKRETHMKNESPIKYLLENTI